MLQNIRHAWCLVWFQIIYLPNCTRRIVLPWFSSVQKATKKREELPSPSRSRPETFHEANCVLVSFKRSDHYGTFLWLSIFKGGMCIVGFNRSTSKCMDSSEENTLTVTSLWPWRHGPLCPSWGPRFHSFLPPVDELDIFPFLHAAHCTYAPSQDFTVPFHF